MLGYVEDSNLLPLRNLLETPPAVMAALDMAMHASRQVCKRLDGRVIPGHDKNDGGSVLL